MPGWLRSWMQLGMAEDGAPPSSASPQPDGPAAAGTIRLFAIVLAATLLLGGAGWFALSYHHYKWAVIVVAGDWHAEDGSSSGAFDNARRDISAELRKIGFDDAYTMQFSARPDIADGTYPMPSVPGNIAQELELLTSETPQGCIVYFSSHGAPQGIVLGNTLLTPNTMAAIVDGACGERPTVVIVSACFSGVFVPVLKGDDRMIVTAARADRSSFGCTQDARYPYFDTCVVQNLPDAGSFPKLADRVKACVAKREADTGATPPSEPQVFIGRNAVDRLPTW
jgi:hypothetical protein